MILTSVLRHVKGTSKVKKNHSFFANIEKDMDVPECEHNKKKTSGNKVSLCQ